MSDDILAEISERIETYVTALQKAERDLLRDLYLPFRWALGECFRHAEGLAFHGVFSLLTPVHYEGDRSPEVNRVLEGIPREAVASFLCILSAPNDEPLVRSYDLGVEEIEVHWRRNFDSIEARFYRVGWVESSHRGEVAYNPPYRVLRKLTEEAS